MRSSRFDARSLRKATLLSTVALLAGLLPFSARGQTIPTSACSGVDATTCFAGDFTNAYILQQNFSGGSFDTYTTANISIVNDLSIQNPITITSGGLAGGDEVGESGAAGNGGGAGSIELVNDGEISWTGEETGTNPDNEIELLYIVADGGEGGHPDEHGDGGVGGNGGFIQITNNESLSASGSFAAGVQGIHAFAAGGDGGPGNDSSINHHGGNGGAGGTINQIQNNAQILLGTTTQSISGNGNAIAIYARSAGGDGGANGYSNSDESGGHEGNGGGGAAVVVENNDNIVINWDSADGVADTLVGIQAISIGGNGSASAHNEESGGLGGSSGNVTVQNYADITVISQDDLSTGGGIVVQSTGGDGGMGQKQSNSGTDGIAGSGGGADEVWVYHNSDAEILTEGYELPGIVAISRGGAGGSGDSGWEANNSSGGAGGGGGNTTIGLTSTASIHTTGDLSPGVLAQGIGGYGGDGGTDGGLVGESGGAGEGGDGGEIDLSSEGGNSVETEGDFSYGMAAQSIGGGGGVGGDFYGVLGGAGGDGGRGGNAQTAQVTAAGQITTSGDHSYAILAQSIAGGGGAGGIAVGAVALGGDGGAGGTGGSATVTNTANINTSGYAAHGILAQSIGGGGGAAGMAGGVLAIGGDGAASYTANGGSVTVTQNGNVTTTGAAAVAVMAQSIGGGGGSGAGAAGIGAIGGSGSAGGAGGTVTVTLTGDVGDTGSITTSGAYAHGLLAQSIGGGGGNGGNVIDFTVGTPSFGVGGAAEGGGAGGQVTVDFDTSFILTSGDHSTGIMAQSLGGGGGNGGDATGIGGLSLIQLTIGGNAGAGGYGNSVTVTGAADNVGIVTFGSFSHGVVAQSIGGGGGNGGNAYGFDAEFNFAAQVAVGGKGGSGGNGGTVTVNWEGSVIQTGNIDNPPPPGQPVDTTGQPANSYGILAQSIGGGGGNGGSATIDQFVFSIPDGDIPIPTVTLGAAVGGKGAIGGAGETVNVTVSDAIVMTVGPGSHAILMQSIGGGGGTGGDATMLAVVGAIPKTTTLPAVDVKLSLGGTGGVGGNAGPVNFTLNGSTAQIVTWGDNANAVVAQAIGGGGGDAGAGNSSTYDLGEPSSVNARFTLGGSGGSGGTGGAIVIDMTGAPVIQTLGAGSRGIVAQSIGGGGGTSQGGTGALGAGSFTAIVEVGRQGGGGSDASTVTVTNTADISTFGGDADGMLLQSIGGGGGVGGTFAPDGSLDDPNWVYVISNTVKEIKEIAGDASYSMTVTVGGAGGTAGAGQTVDVTNQATIVTLGDWADGIVAQSIGGGGGVGGSAAAYGVQQTVDANVGVGGKGGTGGNGGTINLYALGSVQTAGYGAYGVLAQSIGGGGGQGGDGSTKASGAITVGSGAGGGGGTGGIGGTVSLQGGGTVVTTGDDAHALVLQSIGGGGGTGGQGNSQSAAVLPDRAFDIIVGGAGGASGSGGTVQIAFDDPDDSLTISTAGDRSFGVVAQSIGGGGGIGGAGAATSITSVVVGGSGGSGAINGGEVTLDLQASTILTSGTGAHAIVAQSIGGGGGIGGDASGAPLSLGGSGTGNYGDGAGVSIQIAGTVLTTGDYAHGILAQSISGGGGFGGDASGSFAGSNGNLDSQSLSGPVAITVGGTLTTSGVNSIGIFAQSAGGGTNGQITIDVTGVVIGGSGDHGEGVHVDEGSSSNSLTIEAGGSVTALSGNAIVYTGSATLNTTNAGDVQANVDLRNDVDFLGLFNNQSGGRLFAGTLIDAQLENRGLFVVGLGNGALETTVVGGNFTQFAEGETKIDADLAANVADVVEVKGQAVLDGDMSFNFLNLLPNGEALVLSADGGVTGALTPASSGIFDFALTQQGNEVHLSVGGANFQTGGLPASQAAVAGHLQSIWDAGGNGDFGPVFASIENAAASGGYEDVLSDLSPGVALAPAARSGPAAQIFTNSLLSCPVFEGDGALLTEGACGWARVAGRITDQSENDGVAGFDNSRVTYQAGGQLEVADDWFVGGSLAYEMSWFSGDDDRVTSDGDAVFIGAAVKHTMDSWLFAASVGGGFGWYDTERAVGMTGDVAKSSPDVQSVAGRLRAAYTLDQDSWYLRPIADLELIYVRAPGYSESGAGALDLEYEDAEQFTVAFSPALEVGGRVELGGGYVLRPFGLIGVSVLSNDDWDVSTRFAGAPGGADSFETSLPLDRVIGRVNAGVQLMAAEGFDVRLTYDGEFSSHITSHAGALTVAIPF